MIHKIKHIIITVILVILIFASSTHSGVLSWESPSLSWDAVENADGYNIYHRRDGEDFNYDQRYTTTETKVSLSNFTLSPGTYFFMARSYIQDENGSKCESENSMEVSWTVTAASAGGCFVQTVENLKIE